MNTGQPAAVLAEALRSEQSYVNSLYARVEEEREQAQAVLAEVHARGAYGGTRQALTEREVLAPEHSRRIAQLNSSESGLCFGRLDTEAAGVVRRRHLHSTGRTLTGIDDEVFDSALLHESGRHGVENLRGEAALLAALHRAAYLLYAHRRTLARRGVLVVGPNAVFLRYIGEVLPSLGESDVVLTSVGGLFPGLQASTEDSADAAVVKGDSRMARVLAEAVQLKQRAPEGDLIVPLDDEEAPVRVPHEACVRARQRAQSLGAPHNMARKRFVTDMLAALVQARAVKSERPLDEEELRHGPAELWRQRSVRHTLDALWPQLTPQQLVGRLLCDSAELRSAAEGVLEPREQEVLLRQPESEWTVGDVPLLDEAAELLGEDDSADRARERAARSGAYDCSPGSRRPQLGLRPRHRGRGAGTVRDGVADGDAAGTQPLDDAGRRRGADGQPGRRPVLGADARPVRGGPLAPGAADGQLPHSG